MYLLDTNVVSEIRKIQSGKADLRVASWAQQLNVADLYLSVITIEELAIGVTRSEVRDPIKGQRLRYWLDVQVMTTFQGRILSLDLNVALQSAKFQSGSPRPIRDCYIAATAAVHGLTVVTRNISDFEPTGVKLLNPWTEVQRAGS